jgi:predicted enzyme related to lactoylglutathione lyase
MSPLLLAGIPVTDLAAAIDWYGRLFGDDDPFVPNDTEAVWDLAEDRSVYVALLPERAGHAMVSLYVDDLDAWTESAASSGVHRISSETYDNGVRRVVFRDADGNEFALGGMPADDA